MPIDVLCQSCGQKFRVPEQYAGKRVKCPKCQAGVQVPGPTSPPRPGNTGQAAPKPVPSGAGQWYLQNGGGEQFGPVSKSELDGWLVDGRIDPSCQILCEGWEGWKWAEAVYPQLATDAAQAQPAPGSAFISAKDGSPWTAAGADAGSDYFSAIDAGAAAPSSLGSSTWRPRKRLRKKPKSLLDFIDLKFEHYLTPVMLKVVWGLALLLAAIGICWGGLEVVASVLPEPKPDATAPSHSSSSTSGSRPYVAPSAGEQKVMEFLLKVIRWARNIVEAIIVLLMVRVICEFFIVLFDIAESMASIDRKTKPS
jgi:hypothetical protein